MNTVSLTAEQMNDLAVAYSEAMEQTADSYHAAHMFLIAKLNGYGYSVQSKEEAFRIAEQLLWGRV